MTTVSFDPEKTWDGSEDDEIASHGLYRFMRTTKGGVYFDPPLPGGAAACALAMLVQLMDQRDAAVRRAESASAEAHDRGLELEAANEINDRLQRALERSAEEAIALRLALEDEQRLRVEAETKLRRAESSELLYENVLDRCADYLMGADPIMAIPQHEIDRAKRAGVSTQYAEGYHRRIMAALVAGREAETRARSCVQQGLAGVSDEDLAREFFYRFNPSRCDVPSLSWNAGSPFTYLADTANSFVSWAMSAKRLAEGA